MLRTESYINFSYSAYFSIIVFHHCDSVLKYLLVKHVQTFRTFLLFILVLAVISPSSVLSK